jgi:hypothetical protein
VSQKVRWSRLGIGISVYLKMYMVFVSSTRTSMLDAIVVIVLNGVGNVAHKSKELQAGLSRGRTDGRTDDRTMAAGVSVTWTHCSVLFEVTSKKTR